APPHLKDTVFHLYVDADADPTTGRKSAETAPHRGTDYMLSVIGGMGRSTQYDAEGHVRSGPPVSFAVEGNTLLVSADINLKRDDRGVRYSLYVLCHTLTSAGPAPMSDSTPRRLIAGIPITNRAKILRLSDYRENHGVIATYGVHRLQRIERDPQNIVVPHDRLETDGFRVDHQTVRRWPHLTREKQDARAWTTAPKPGRFHIGFMMYDDARDERIGIYVEKKLVGVAVANRDNNTTWLYCTERPIQLEGGERVELRAAGPSGRHGICNILFLKQRPEPRDIEYAVENMTAVTPVGQPGKVILSWTTTWPCPTRFEYGTDTEYGQTILKERPCLVHRVVLDGLDPKLKYHGRAIGARRDGTAFFGDDFVFQADPPPVPETQSQTTTVPITVRNPHSVAAKAWPITTGIPVPQGILGDADHVRLMLGEEADDEVPLQVRITGRWPDGSVKWLLLSFLADIPAEGQTVYPMQFGRGVRRTAGPLPAVRLRKTDRSVHVDTGPLQFEIDPHGNLTRFRLKNRPLSAGDAVCETVATDADGADYTTRNAAAKITVEESGPVRAVIKVVSDLRDAGGKRLFRIEKRIEAYAGQTFLRIHHTLVVDRPDTKFVELDRLAYRVPGLGLASAWRVPTVRGRVTLDQVLRRVWQQFDNVFFLDPTRKSASGTATGRIVGAAISTDPSGCAVAVRDFWQNYPKGFALRPGAIDIELCPDFEPGLYDKFPFEKEGHHLYYYLLNGRYKIKTGVAKTHELLLCFSPAEQREAVCQMFQRPPLATAPPQWYCDSKAFYDVAPRDPKRFRLYEEAIDRNLKAYLQRRDRQHDYGMLNYGDWYGERGANWGNIEYDTQHAFFLEYIRSGNPEAFFLGEATELHNRDVDTVQFSPDPQNVGAVYVHQMCHVGEYYTKSVPGTLGFPRGGFTVSHAWVEGHFAHYFLTGDPRSDQTGRAVADYFVRKELGRPYDFSSTRVPGWHLIMLSAAYHATGDPYYLNAARVIVRHVLETQDVEPRPLPDYQAQGRKPCQLGGWSRMMVPGHCRCEPRHRGNAGFMIAVLLSGLKYYHDITGDPAVKETIIRAAHYLLDETYSDKVHGFRYTSCPKTSYRPGASPLMVEGVARAYLWTKDERFRRVLVEALPLSAGGSPYGKSFSMYYRCGPRVLADLAATGLTLNSR
ncbi:MAG: hypothetical protein GXP27_07120, partial [Planctomycetes bacterium]|nr:hypothetical protein [Planctomycetota bacterium]